MLKHDKVKYAINDQITRWNSTFMMVERLIELKDFCIRHQKSTRTASLDITDDSMWEAFISLNQVLDPVAKLTTKLQAENLLIPDFIYHWLAAKHSLKNMSNNTKQRFNIVSSQLAAKLIENIEFREKQIFNNEIILAGWYLDKWINVTMSGDQKKTANNVLKMVHKKLENLTRNNNSETVEVGQVDEGEIEDDDEFDKHLGSLGKELYAESTSINSVQASTSVAFDKELQSFASLKVPQKRPDNLMIWWNHPDQAEKFPTLKKVALNVISVPITEVSVERLFSHLGMILTKCRSSLSGKKLDDILFLRMNQKFESSNI